MNGNLSSAVQYNNLEAKTHRGISINDSNVSPFKIIWSQPVIQGNHTQYCLLMVTVFVGFQPISTRQIFTLPPPSSVINNTVIQSMIDKASAFTGERPIVYLPLGTYMYEYRT